MSRRTAAQNAWNALVFRAVAVNAEGKEAVCPICGAAYLPTSRRQITCPPCHQRFVAAGLSWRERADKVLTAKIKALLDVA